jgi:hypothetical protein
MTLSAVEFLRRFLLHVLPLGFKRIREFGLLANRHRQEKLAQARGLLHSAPWRTTAQDPADGKTAIGPDTPQAKCPICGHGTMIRIDEVLPSAEIESRVAIVDTS